MGNKIIVGVIIIIVVVLIAWGLKGSSDPLLETPESQNDQDVMEEMPVEGSQEEEMIAEESAREIDVEGRPFSFTPSVITVQAGERVQVNFMNAQGIHDFVIEGTDIRTSVINQGTSESVEFTLEEPGEYVFYCSVPGHREAGMVGTIIVE
jgi:plastocyanin